LRTALAPVAALAFSLTALADEILITGGQQDEPRLVFCNYFAPDQPAIQDIGVPAGGLDAKCDLLDDLATIVLWRPTFTGYIASSQWPVAFACGLRVGQPSAIKIEASVIAGPYLLDTGPAAVHWNGEKIGSFDGTGKRRRKSQQEIREFSVTVPAEKVKLENLLHLSPGKAGPLALVDAIKVSAETEVEWLPREKAASLFKTFGEYEDRSVRGKGKILVCATHLARSLPLRLAVCGALGAEVVTNVKMQKWIPASEWEGYRLVILDTLHEPSKAEERLIVDFVHGGGVLILTPYALSGFVKRAQREKDASLLEGTPDLDTGDAKDLGMLECMGGFGVAVVSPASGELALRVKKGPYTLSGALKAEERAFPMRAASGRLFTIGEDVRDEDVRVIAVASDKKDDEHAAFFVHRVGKGAVFGTVLPTSRGLLKMVRNVVVSVMDRPEK